MKTDLHIHSKCSDGRMTLSEIFEEARRRNIDAISITDHDSLDCQESAEILAKRYGMHYLTGLELNVSFSHPDYKDSRSVSLDFLAYGYDIHYRPLDKKLTELREHRRKRAGKILENINLELAKEHIKELTSEDLQRIEDSVDGTFGRPHLADYMVKIGLVANKQEAFDKYLVKCDVPKMPLSIQEASALVHGAGGTFMLAHPNDPHGTSLLSFTASLQGQQKIIKETMLHYIDGIECWHSRHDPLTSKSYLTFARELGLMVTGGSDCHQNPVIMGMVDIPEHVWEQFELPK
jgi:3',5'-nucleoside bisphosphate phosphatase